MHLRSTLPLLAAGVLSLTPAFATEPLPIHERILEEALRPNHDPAGRPLPLAARWTNHNWLGSIGRHQVTYPFTLERVLDEIEAGHHIMPFMGWPRPGGAYFEPFEQLEASFHRLAASGMPFEFEAGNIEDGMFTSSGGKDGAEALWNRPARENPAHLDSRVRGRLSEAAGAETSALSVEGFPAEQRLTKGAPFLLDSPGRVYTLAEEVTTDKEGRAVLLLSEALEAPVAAGTEVFRIHRRMDYWSPADHALWDEGGYAMATHLWGVTAEAWARLAAVYPDPPLIQIVSNNEGGGNIGISAWESSWHAVSQQDEFAKQFPEPREDSPLRLAYARGYIDHMRAYFQGIRRGLPWEDETIQLIGYNAFGMNFEVGRWGGWRGGMVPFKQADSFPWLAWDGSAPDFYVYDWNYATDEHVGSPHIGAMQAYTMLAPRAEEQVPDYQWQLAVWDGGVRMRYRYAAEGTIPATSVAGVLAHPIETSGISAVRIRGAAPGSPVLREGEFFSIEGHSEIVPATATLTLDKIQFMSGEDHSTATPELEGVDIGEVILPGAIHVKDGAWTIKGGGQIQRGSSDDLFFARADFSGMGRIEARIDRLTNPDQGLVSDAGVAELPDSAKHVDARARADQEAIDRLVSGGGSGARGGLMIRSGDAPNAAFVGVARTPTGALLTVWRNQDGRNLEWSGWNAMTATPEGPVHVALEQRDEHQWEALWSVDGAEWKSLRRMEVRLGDTPKAGVMVTAWNNPGFPMRLFTAATDVIADSKGEAVIPIAVFDQAGPVIVNDRLRAVAEGAEVRIHDYVPRYEGLNHLALWLTRPRIIREFAWGDFDGQIEAH